MTTAPDTALLTSTSESLTPLLPILDGFAHRHKNQHSSTHWWSSFSLLRRAVRNLAQDLVVARPKKKTKSSSNSAKPNTHPALVRAKWMMRHLVPDAFITFSQLAADNQYAPLGLLLLSVLARTNTLLSLLVPSEHDYASPSTDVENATSSVSDTPDPLKSTVQSIAVETPDAETDMGVAISREELLLPQKKTSRSIPKSDMPSKDIQLNERKSKTVPTATSKRSSKDDTKDKPKKKKKKGGDALSSLFGSL
ncbi:ribonuclease mrp protein subunit rmp1 [Fusarium sporotrichioides]|uniref:Ribonuclease mrp protein subunit rmp1 n=1 Tax=Fusarium sporotrichioides TaxID=5514 RepID=A0A395RKM4_FUSSP|nr:ribonuclease mrp protein subunit rmp1 [Fusarium sporotrichioides]